MTVLANEQVIDGRGWRSGALVEQRKLTQWFLKITDYRRRAARRRSTPRPLARKSAADAGELDRPLGGPAVRFALDPNDARPPTARRELEVYTTRPDTLFGASFVAVAPDHPLAAAAARDESGARRFIDECKRGGTVAGAIETAEKHGFDTGLARRPSVRPDVAAAGLCRQLHPDGLRHGRHLRLPGARPARPRLRPQIRPR